MSSAASSTSLRTPGSANVANPGALTAPSAVTIASGTRSRTAGDEPGAQVHLALPLLIPDAGGQLGCRCEPDDPCDVLGGAPAIALLPAARVLGRERDAMTDPQRTNALGAVQLVRRDREEVDAELRGMERNPSEGLHGVRVDERARVAPVHGIGDGGDVLDRARLVVDEHDGNKDGLRCHGLCHNLGTDATLAVASGDGDRGHTGLLEVVCRLENRVVLDRTHHDMPAALTAPALEHPADRQVVRLGAGTREHDLSLRAAQHCGDPVARPVDGRTRHPAGLVHRRRVPLRYRQIRHHLVEHLEASGVVAAWSRWMRLTRGAEAPPRSPNARAR